ncbi:MAG: glycosyltransferase family 2 protein [Steroidobacteraceae bacterium]
MQQSVALVASTEVMVSRRRRQSVSCVVPVFNEQSSIERFLAALAASVSATTPDFELVVVNDGSNDESAARILGLLQSLPIHYIEFSRNFGKEAAIQSGLDAARGDGVIIIDADFQHPLEIVPQMIKRWREGYDAVIGVRRDRRGDSVWRRLFSRCFYALVDHNGHYRIRHDSGDFRLLDRRAVDVLRRIPERSRFMKGLYAWVGFRSIDIEYDVAPRIAGKSRFRIIDLIDLSITAITSFSVRPVRMLSIAGAMLAVVALAFALYVMLEKLVYGQPIAGFTTLAAALFFFGGIQLIGLGILGEYIARIFEEVKQRPLYVTANEIDQGLGSPREGLQTLRAAKTGA